MSEMKTSTQSNAEIKDLIKAIRKAHRDAEKTKSQLDRFDNKIKLIRLEANKIKKKHTIKTNEIKRLIRLYSEQSTQVFVVDSRDYFAWGLDQNEIEKINRIIA
jgi:predicted RNase H-like nuclease (RuvC/YqgF family)